MDRRSYTGYAFILNGGAVTWDSKKQKTVALSSTEAEYMALAEATREVLYLRKLLHDFDLNVEEFVIINDNMGAGKLASNPVFHGRTKHIDIRHHFVREAMEEGLITIRHAPTEEMAADILTKGLSKDKHHRCVQMLGLRAT